jgi:hypothetical protein
MLVISARKKLFSINGLGFVQNSGTPQDCGVRLAALLAQPHPKPPVLGEHVLNLHAERRADAGERIDHEGDQRAVAQARRRRGRIEHRRALSRGAIGLFLLAAAATA